jgi:hypothetical protein
LTVLAVQKIACCNDAAFVMSFAAACSDGRSSSTDTYPIDQTRVIDLASAPFKLGTEFWPRVNAVLGNTQDVQDAREHVVFAMNGQTATYEVKGTTLHYSITLIG